MMSIFIREAVHAMLIPDRIRFDLRRLFCFTLLYCIAFYTVSYKFVSLVACKDAH